MKVMFVYGAFENIGIEYISAILKQHGHHTALVFDPMLFDDPFIRIRYLKRILSFRDILLKQIIDYNPDILAFSVVSSYYAWALDIANKVREDLPSVHITFGGVHPSSVPDKVLENQCIDSVILGEGEYPLLELTNSLQKGKINYSIRNIWFRNDGQITRNALRPYIEDLDTLPFPDKDMYYELIPQYKTGYTVITRRGCINSCSYCHNSIWQMLYPDQRKIRFRSVGNVIGELQYAKKKYRFRRLRINDDLFTCNSDWLREFSMQYKKNIDIATYCFGSSGTINEEIIRYLKEIKCYQICIGVQSTNPYLRNTVLNRPDDNNRIKEAICLCKKYKIRCVVDNIIGIPGETEQDLVDMAQFYNKNRPDRVCVFWLVYFPKTPIIDDGLREGVLSEEIVDELAKSPHDSANTLKNQVHSKNKVRYHWLLFLLHFLPTGIYSYFIERKLYRFLPLINPSGIEALFTMFSRDRLDIPRRRYYARYSHFIKKLLKMKLKRLISR